MQELRVFVLGRMVPEGAFSGDSYRYVRRTKTVQIASIVEGAAKALHADEKIDSTDKIRVLAPEGDDRTNIVHSVLNHVEGSDLIIIDVSDESPSVIYELGAVNALGKPYILVTGESLPFYLLQSRSIMNFSFKDEYDPGDLTHVELRNRLLSNYTSEDGVGFSESVFSSYFQGLPIVNIAGPAGIATGYHVNTLNRFGRQGAGFLQKVVKVVEDDGGQEPVVREGRLSALVVVIPDIVKTDNYGKARVDLEDAMAEKGLPLMSASILEKKDGEYNNLGFGAMMLREHPDIVVDIPRTVYPLSMVPRIRIARENEQRFGAPAGRRRQLRRLMREFRAILDWNMANERAQNDGAWGQIHFVEQADVADYIHNLVNETSS